MYGYDTTEPTTATFCQNCGTLTGSTFYGQWIHYHPTTQPTVAFEVVLEAPRLSKRRHSDVERWLRATVTDRVRADEAIAKLRRHTAAVRECRALQVGELPEVQHRGRATPTAIAWGFEHRQRCRTARKARPLPLREKTGEKR